MKETCPRCGAPLDARGLCPRCLLEAVQEPAGDVVLTGSGSAPPSSPPSSPRIEELAPHFPAFAIEERIGVGGTGTVYRALHKGLERRVALKVLHPHVADDAGFAGRFEREARTLAALQHPNLVTVYDCGRAGPWYFFAMELVDGADLRQVSCAREIGAREALAVVMQLCDALQYAHDQGVVHRDIKPENILLDRQGRVKVLDFGLAKLTGQVGGDLLTRTHQVMGTPHYMAPEQWERPTAVDHRADIFSLGVVFYELLTGELPVGRFEPPSKRVRLDVRLDQVVLRTLEREPERRYQKASAVGLDVERIHSGPEVAPSVEDPKSSSQPEVKRSRRSRSRAPERRKGEMFGCVAVVYLAVFLFALTLFFVFLGSLRN